MFRDLSELVEADRATAPLTPAETTMLFLGWVTTRDESVTLGATASASDAIVLFDEFNEKYVLGDIRNGFEDVLVKRGQI